MSELTPLEQINADGKLIAAQIASAEIDPVVKHLLGEILALHEGGISAVAEEIEQLEEVIEEIDEGEEIVQEDRATVILTGLAAGMGCVQKLIEIVQNDASLPKDTQKEVLVELNAAAQQIVLAQQAVAEVTVPVSSDGPAEEPDGNG